MTERTRPADPAALSETAWSKMSLHCDGVAIGSAVYALNDCGLLGKLAEAAAPIRLDELAEQYRLRRGYLHLAMKLLAGQGLVRRSGDLSSGQTCVELSEQGRPWHRLVGAYAAIPTLLQQAISLLTQTGAPPVAELRSRREPSGAGSGLVDRVCRHVNGALVAAAMTLLDRCRAFQILRARPGAAIPTADLPCDPLHAAAALEILTIERWAVVAGESAALTPEGLIASQLAPQYFYPASYLPTYQAVPDLLRGRALPKQTNRGEQHLDRELDIAFSGKVFQRSCREPFLAMALPIFRQMPVEDQPSCVVDTGCGDGTLLIELFKAIRAGTPRGQRLAENPLLMVGVDYNQLAREVARRKFREAALPHIVVPGDVGDPDGLAATLAAQGIDMRQALHVSKSVIHNRTFRRPKRPRTNSLGGVESTAVFVAPDGTLIQTPDLLDNLVEHFEAWRPWVGRHGMIVIEAHTVDPDIVAAYIGRSLVTVLDASHGFSHQYLVEIEVHRAAAAAAGFIARDRRDLGGWMVGRPILSIDHLCVAHG
jgi:SAM-dependent methyltransferase